MAAYTEKKILKKIKKYQNIVIARHIGPDPDAVASQIALRESLKKTFPSKNIYAIGNSVSKFKYLGTLDKVPKDLNDALLIMVDVPNLERVDDIETFKYKESIKIDHHPWDKKVCDVELVNEKSTSACQIIAELIIHVNLKLDKEIASLLFLGIVSDSDRFLIKSTDLSTFKTVSNLIKRTNLDFTSLYEKLYERPINEIKFHGFLSENLEVKECGLAYVFITPSDLKKYNVDTATPSNMINDFNFIKDILVWTFITYDEKNDLFKINIRSRGPIVNEVASHYNGGGHKFASGARCKEKKDALNMLEELEKVCKLYKKEK